MRKKEAGRNYEQTRRADHEIQLTEDELRLFISVSSLMMYRMSADWTRMENLVGKELLADTPEPITGWMDKYILPEDQEMIRGAIAAAIDAKAVFDLEHRVIGADGSIVWVHSRAVPMLNAAGGITHWLGTGTDITDRKWNEASLREQEEKYRTLFNSIDEGFCVIEVLWDEEGHLRDLLYHEVNAVFVKRAGFDPTGKKFSEWVPDIGVYRSWMDFYEGVAKTGQAARAENYVEVLGTWETVFASRMQGNDSLLAVVFNDITEHKLRDRQQQYLLKLSDALRRLSQADEIQGTAARLLGEYLGASRVVYVEVTEHEYIVRQDYVNGIPSMRGRHPIRDYGAGKLAEYLDGRTRVVRDTRADEYNSFLDAKNFEAIGVRAGIGVPLVKDGRFVVNFVVHMNQPRNWTAHEILLTEETAERTWATVERARVEQALRESEQQLRKLLKLRDEFIGAASHELKTPVTSMKAYAEMVQENLEMLDSPANVEIMSRLIGQIDRLTSLINTLLDTSRIAEGQLVLRLEPIDLNELIRERVDEISRTSKHQFELDLSLLPTLVADRERIRQVLTNLLSNAIKYSAKGTTIYLSSWAEGDVLCVSVRDEGYGIPEADIPRIFDRFYRVTSNQMDSFPGMGLGLYISEQIVQRHGGTIEVQSALHQGSTFSFRLPGEAGHGGTKS